MQAPLHETPTSRLIRPMGPFAWHPAMGMLSEFGPLRRFRPGNDGTTRLAFALDGTFQPVGVALRPAADGIRAEVAGHGLDPEMIEAAIAQAARIFTLDVDGSAYPDVARRDPAQQPVMDALPGLRPVAFPSAYETAAWAILSQRISMRQAAVLQDRLLEVAGEPVDVDGTVVRAYPHPARLLELRSVPGLPDEKVRRLQGVAEAALAGLLDTRRLRTLDPVTAQAELRQIRGIGPFWAAGIHLRGCNVQDAFPDEPLSVAALGVTHGLGTQPSPDDVARISDAWRPFRMWVCFLLRVAAARGIVPGIAGREAEIRRGTVGANRGRARRSSNVSVSAR
jgi:DNA-3-methyladenine glycosylase II